MERREWYSISSYPFNSLLVQQYLEIEPQPIIFSNRQYFDANPVSQVAAFYI